MITAAPIIRKPLSVLGHPGMTDFSVIYIASELNAAEYRATLRHEQAHVWCGHNRRVPANAQKDQWMAACEMEIARNIYDRRDIDAIKAPRSRLTGGYLPDSIADLPADLLLAEEIYEWLVNHPPQDKEQSIACGASCSCKSETEESAAGSVSISDARKKMDEDEAKAESAMAAKTAYKDILNRQPSITDEIDAALRYRIVREDSFRRPSRRESSNDVIRKGKLTTPRPPLVEIFVDRSGSFDSQKTAKAEEVLRRILSRYGASIKYDTWYFGGGRLSSADIAGGGDTPYHLIADHLLLSKPKMAIVITDDDPVGNISPPPVRVACVPVGCTTTKLSAAFRGVDVATP